MPNLRITSTGSFSFTQSGVYATGGDNEALEILGGQMHYTIGGIPLDPYGAGVWPKRFKPFTGEFLLTGTPEEVNTRLEALEAQKGTRVTVTGRAGTTTRTILARLMTVSQRWSIPRRDGAEQWLYITCQWEPLGEWT
jgi:hypothetical protein